MELVSFDRFSMGIAYLAERRRPEGLMNGDISSERMDNERKRQFRLWESAVLAEQQSMQTSFTYDNNDSSDNFSKNLKLIKNNDNALPKQNHLLAQSN